MTFVKAVRNQMVPPCVEWWGEMGNQATTPFNYCSSTAFLPVRPHHVNARRNRCQEDLSGFPLENWIPLKCPRTTWMKTLPEWRHWFQIGGACLQAIAWSCSAVPVGRLSTRYGHGTSTSQVFRRLHVCRPTDTVTDWRQEFLCSRTAAMKQPTDRDPEERHYIWTL